MSESNSVSDVPSKAVVIYHDNCVDGFASAWAFKQLAEKDYKDGVVYVPMQYGKSLLSEGLWDLSSDIFILDFSFPRNTLINLARAFASVTVLDHHKTAAEALSGWDHGFSNLEIVFDMERSGAGISWDYFADPDEPRPMLIDYVEDRDIWKWELPDSKEINSLIGFTKKEFDAYDRLQELIGLKRDAAVGMGSLLLEQQQRHVQSIIAATKRPIEINGKHGLICNCPGQFASDVGNELAKESGTFGATCYQGADEKIHFSLRSIGDYDVSAMARDFGGGGHKNAAGFVMEIISENPGGSGVTLYNTGLGDLEEMADGNT
jgi:oligoribonuclease NrnB/cAMP/cGMP phosphodiesterase (DHH superfamily)